MRLVSLRCIAANPSINMYNEANVRLQAIAKAAIDGFCIPPEFYADKDFGEYTADAYAQATATIEVFDVAGCFAYAADYIH